MDNQSIWLKKLRHVTERGEIPAVWQEDFQERAAILEYDGGLSTADAEAQAKREILARLADFQKGTN
jgi:hypothetical protein